MTMSASATIEAVREYYGSALKSSADLKTTACCAAEAPAPHLASILERIHPEVTERFYGCGCPLPPALEGATVLDLGCGSGRDCYMLSRVVTGRSTRRRSVIPRRTSSSWRVTSRISPRPGSRTSRST